MQPDVSVIVPVYNTMPYLRETLASLTGQSIAPGRLEVIAVDDGSTDGSGEELDRVAAAHPGLFTVIHQANSGGPAHPCNRGLEVARGRYVFFLGSDDHLDPEAFERMVAAADEWESDVLCCRLVGTGGRWVNQSLFTETRAEVPFPSALLATALSNTKLFRRSVIEQHQIRYPEDLKVGSDQPFTIEAMLHARRVSVLADRAYYYAVRREGMENITYTSTWQSRLRDLGAVVRKVASLLPVGEARDEILQRHFTGELATLLRRDFGELEPDAQAELVAGLNELAADFLTDGIRARMRPLARVRFRLAAAGDLEALRRLHEAEDDGHRVHVDDDAVRQVPWIYAEQVHDPEFVVSIETRKTVFGRAVREGRISLDGSVLRGEIPTSLAPEIVDRVCVSVVNAPKAAGWGVRLQTEPDRVAPRRVPVTIADGVLRFSMDLAEVPRIKPGLVMCPRIDVVTSEGRYRLPVRSDDAPVTTFTRNGVSLVARAFPDKSGRTLLEIERSI